MQRKELLAVLILTLVVAVSATARFFSPPLRSPTSSGVASTRSGPGPTRERAAPDKAPVIYYSRLSSTFPPGDPDAGELLLAADILYSKGDYGLAALVYQRFLKKQQDERQRDPRRRPEPAEEPALLRIGQCYSYDAAGRWDEAAEQYEMFLKAYPNSEYRPMALLWSGRSHVKAGKIDIARKRLDEVISQYPASDFAKTARATLADLDARVPTPPSTPPKSGTATQASPKPPGGAR